MEFASALEATRCAIEIQRTMSQRNQQQPPERAIRLRIGIHVGDIVQKDGKVMGDAVNIAARIGPMAEPGGTCLSQMVYDQVQNKLEGVSLKSMGERQLKNIQTPIKLYQVVEFGQQAQGVSAGRITHALPGRRGMRSWIWLGPAALLGIGLAWWLVAHPRTNTHTSGLTPTNAPGTAPLSLEKTIAVLPFDNRSPDKSDEYLSDGLTDHLTTALSQVRGLRVKGRTSAFAFKGKTNDISQIAERLKVSTILEGSMQRAGNQLRITAQLNTADGFQIWATNYDRDMTDLFAVQSDVARHVVNALKIQLKLGEQERLIQAGTSSLDAYHLYLQGRFLWNKRGQTNLESAIAHFEQAVRVDGWYAQAYSGLADCNLLLPFYAPRLPKETFPKAVTAAQHAIALDDGLAEAHTSLAYAKFLWEWDWPGAEREFQRALELNPDYANAHHWYSIYLEMMRRFDDAVIQAQLAVDLDPLSVIIHADAAGSRSYAGQHDRALKLCEEAVAIDPMSPVGHQTFGMIYLMMQRPHDAVAALEKARVLGSTDFIECMLGVAYRRSGRDAEAKRVLNQLLDTAKDHYVSPLAIAGMHAALGDKEAAFAWLEKAYQDRSYLLAGIRVWTWFEGLRTDPRFKIFSAGELS